MQEHLLQPISALLKPYEMPEQIVKEPLNNICTV